MHGVRPGGAAVPAHGPCARAGPGDPAHLRMQQRRTPPAQHRPAAAGRHRAQGRHLAAHDARRQRQHRRPRLGGIQRRRPRDRLVDACRRVGAPHLDRGLHERPQGPPRLGLPDLRAQGHGGTAVLGASSTRWESERRLRQELRRLRLHRHLGYELLHLRQCIRWRRHRGRRSVRHQRRRVRRAAVHGCALRTERRVRQLDRQHRLADARCHRR